MNNNKKSKEQLIRELSELHLENSLLKRKIIESEKVSVLNVKSIENEEALASERTLLRTLVDILHVFIYVKDRESRFLVVNAACANYMGGASPQELIGKTDKDFYQSGVAEVFRSDEINVLKGIPLINKEERGYDSNGVQMTLLTTKVPLRDKGGNIIGLVGTSIDITESKRAEDALKESEEWFRNLFQQSHDGILYLSTDGKIITVNKAFAEMHGYSIEEIMKMNIGDLDSIETKLLYNEWMAHIKKGENLIFEVTHFHKDGHSIPMEVTAGVITIGSANYILASHRDITERKLTEESLRISEENFRILFEENPLPTILSEISSGKISFANKRMADIMGFKKEDIIGKTANDLGLLKNPGEQAKLTQLISTQGFVDSLELEKVFPDKNGTDLISMRLVKIDGIQYCLTVVLDITERKKAEEAINKALKKAEESDRLKSAFLANMGHEIRTPMNGILGFSELLKNPALTGEEQQEFVSVIEKSGARMLNIINDLIDISKIESGLMQVYLSEFNINEQSEYLYSFFRPEAEGKGLKLTYKNSLNSKEAVIKTDKEKLNAILVNLIKNAIKFTNDGSIEFGYILNNPVRVGEPAELEFFVKDTGVGISPYHKDFIFERFRQGSESLNRNYEGAGLGLSISKHYVEMLGGKIWVQTNPDSPNDGSGSIFYFTIPFIAEHGNNAFIRNDEKDTSRITDKKLRVLIAEDDYASEFLLSRVIKIFSKEILNVRTGVEAVHTCKMNPDIDLVLMDIKMTEMDGYEAARQIRKFNKNVVIIAQTAYAQTGDREKAIDAGCNDYISKPIIKDQLISLIKKHFKNKGNG